MLLKKYDGLLVTTWNYTYNILELACNKLLSIKYIYMISVDLFSEKIPCGCLIVVSSRTSRRLSLDHNGGEHNGTANQIRANNNNNNNDNNNNI